ncbi:hypothetical protein Fot_42167 [Forsythia ovata]|uniref:Uncharacterized protein n=1 Tax=Forsythia ovata TaxID=205694 RepID=A0ABD1RKE7_9LAMI
MLGNVFNQIELEKAKNVFLKDRCSKGCKLKIVWMDIGTASSDMHHHKLGVHDHLTKDKLDPTVLGKLSSLSAVAAALVYKYWTPTWAKATDNTDLPELLKLAEMNTYRSHVLNCELYKVLVMKIDELHSTVVGAKDIDELRTKNKILRSKLAVSEYVRRKA